MGLRVVRLVLLPFCVGLVRRLAIKVVLVALVVLRAV